MAGLCCLDVTCKSALEAALATKAKRRKKNHHAEYRTLLHVLGISINSSISLFIRLPVHF